MGLFAAAVETYRANLRRFPRTPDAGSGLIPLARCYMTLGGEENLELAEKTLVDHILADSPVFTPQAPEFCDALFLLGDLYSGQERFEDSITVLEEALDRYPEDERAVRARLLLANAYRRSALALKADLQETRKASEWPRLRAEMATRLQRAAELFALLVRTFEARDEGDMTDLERLFLKQSRLYQADCLFEMGRHAEAAALYETAAFVYRGEPVALSAYIQVINCRLSLGQLAEARTALRRAEYLLKIMPDRVFEGEYAGQSREEWKRFLDWLDRTKLLAGEQS
jgi:tetratricopeptide (TPR) repeat protein